MQMWRAVIHVDVHHSSGTSPLTSAPSNILLKLVSQIMTIISLTHTHTHTHPHTHTHTHTLTGCYIYTSNTFHLNFINCERVCVNIPISEDVREAEPLPFYVVLTKPRKPRRPMIRINPRQQVAQIDIS